MSREIKFRVWDNNSKIYYYNNIKIFGSGEFSIIDECNGSIEAYNGDSILSDLILEQCTGLKDKNGKEIYEGDILATENIDGIDPDGGTCDTWDAEENEPVKWCSAYSGFSGIPDAEYESMYHKRFMRIIGNIHEDHDKL